MNRKIRVLIVDDHFMVRLGLAEAINHEADMIVIGQARNAAQARDLFRQHQPDLVTMDYCLPGTDGVEATRQIRADFPAARIIMVSVFEGEEPIWRAVQAGVRGYLLKASESEELLRSIRTVHEGGTAFPPAIAAKITARRSREELTPRELMLLRLIVEGRSNKEIAAVVFISEATVKLHITHIFEKLGVHDRTQATTAAIHRGFVHLTT
jgi:DNA-binding NarL/FixJ family response regulator